MYASRTTQLIVGIFALLGIAALAFLSLSLGRLELLPAPGYTLFANFDTIAGSRPATRSRLRASRSARLPGLRSKMTAPM